MSQRKRHSDEKASTSQATKRSRSSAYSQGSTNVSQLMTPISSKRCGKINRMRLTNIMCHSNLVIDFHDRVNFLVGSNGSGKSAVLAALVLGLGGKASSTNRCSSFKQFIKTGEASASIEIEINNDGDDAFEADTYGKKITVVRSVSASGTSSYKLKNESGSVVSKKVDDLHKMLLYHNIQAENPVFVLNQDNARSFLKDLDPIKNYKLFLKATQIETVLECLTHCHQSAQLSKYRFDCQKKESEMLQNEIKDLEKKYFHLQSVKKIKDAVKQYKVEKAWAVVSKQESVIEEIQKSVGECVDEQNKLSELARNKESVERQFRDKIKEFESAVTEKKSLIGVENAKFNELKRDFAQDNERYQNEGRTLEKLKKKKEHLEEQREQLEKHISERSESSTGSIQKMREKNEAQLQVLKTVLKEIDSMISSARHEQKMYRGTKQGKEEAHENLKNQRKILLNEKNVLEGNIATIKSSSKDSLAIYGESVSHFLFAVERAHKEGRFSALPRGPIGRYVEVPNEKYRSLVEHHLGGVLHSFLVNNAKDRMVLDGILKNFPNYKPAIITSKFYSEAYNVREGMVRPPRGTRLLMNEIRCSDNVVLNCLIDRSEIEVILISDEKDVAEQITANVENVPRNLKKVLCLNPPCEYFPDPNYRMYSTSLRPARLIQVNMEQRVKQMEEEIGEKKQEIIQCENQLRQMQDEMKTIYSNIQKNERTLERHEEKRRDVLEKITELENVEYPDSNELDILRKELTELVSKLLAIKQQIDEHNELFNNVRREKIEKERNVECQRDCIKTLEDEISRLNTHINSIKVKMNTTLSAARHNETKIQEIKEKLEQLAVSEHDAANKLQELTTIAEKAGARTDSGMSEEELTDIIGKLEKKIRQRSSTNDNIEDVKAMLEDKTDKLKLAKSNIAMIQGTLETLKASLNKRFSSISNIKRHMAVRVKFSFNGILNQRNFSGQLDVDHDSKKLTVTVIPRDHHIQNSVSNTKSLSGGERSFSTIAFLVSLWSCVDHPFYFLDEYDVFTDQVNREIMTRILIATAQQYQTRQYTFLTPQDMSIKASDLIKIHRLAEPQR